METQITAVASWLQRLLLILFSFAARGVERLDRKSYDVRKWISQFFDSATALREKFRPVVT
jgi:hypothetical protein